MQTTDPIKIGQRYMVDGVLLTVIEFGPCPSQQSKMNWLCQICQGDIIFSNGVVRCGRTTYSESGLCKDLELVKEKQAEEVFIFKLKRGNK